jgi:hypothetical protein
LFVRSARDKNPFPPTALSTSLARRVNCTAGESRHETKSPARFRTTGLAARQGMSPSAARSERIRIRSLRPSQVARVASQPASGPMTPCVPERRHTPRLNAETRQGELANEATRLPRPKRVVTSQDPPRRRDSAQTSAVGLKFTAIQPAALLHLVESGANSCPNTGGKLGGLARSWIGKFG